VKAFTGCLGAESNSGVNPRAKSNNRVVHLKERLRVIVSPGVGLAVENLKAVRTIGIDSIPA
jgi:hypothetical protein